MTARERRGAVALLRAVGADGPSVGLVLAGAAIAVAIPAAIAGIVLEVVAFGPLVARLAAGFAALPLAPTLGQIALVAGGLLDARGDRHRAGRAARAARARRRGAEGGVMRARRCDPPSRLLAAARLLAALRRRRACRGPPRRRPARRSRPRSSTRTATGSWRPGRASRSTDRGEQGQARQDARDLRAADRHPRPRRGVARAGAVPRSHRRAVHVDLPPAGGVLHADARRGRPRAQPADAAGRLRHRRHHGQRAAQRAHDGARDAARAAR